MADANVLVLGGCGFVGRNLVAYLVENNLAKKIRVADKVPPQTAWLNENHKGIFGDERVEFQQVNLLNQSHVDKAFSPSNDGDVFDYVINCGSGIRYGQTADVYEESVYKLNINCAKKAAELNVKRYIELSTGQIYSSDKKASNEESKESPWTLIAKYKLKVDEELKTIPGLNYVILRPAITYGIGDIIGLTPRLIIGAVYKQLGEKMKLLWTKDLKMNTVNVKDVARAIWFLCTEGKNHEVYNLADKDETTQGKISDLVCQIFGIEYDFLGSIVSNMARMNMTDVVEDSNDKHLAPWSEACSKDGISNTPLSPYLDKELLYNNNLHVDGTKIEKLGFVYEYPVIKTEYLREVVDDYVVLGVFPPSLAGK
eukprot:gene18877-20777_t